MSAWRACLLSIMLAGGACIAQPRDGGLQEQRQEDEAAACVTSPECMRLMRARERDDADRQAAYEAKSPWQKVLPYLIFAGICYGLWKWAGRTKK